MWKPNGASAGLLRNVSPDHRLGGTDIKQASYWRKADVMIEISLRKVSPFASSAFAYFFLILVNSVLRQWVLIINLKRFTMI